MPDTETSTETSAAVADPAVAAAALQAEIATLKEQVAEGQRSAQYWADKAKASTPAKAAVAEPEDDTDVLEAITTGGAKGFDALAKKRGFIQRDEVETLINNRAASLTKEQELIGRFPDLKNQKSDFFKSTAANYGDLVKSGVPAAKAMELAAEQSELAFIRDGKIKLPGAEPTKAEKEASRLARIAAQGGGERRGPAAAEEDDGELDANQKRIASAMGITEDAYKKRASTGVAMRSK